MGLKHEKINKASKAKKNDEWGDAADAEWWQEYVGRGGGVPLTWQGVGPHDKQTAGVVKQQPVVVGRLN